MRDPLTPKQRSEHMRRITKYDTSPEIAVRRLLHSLDYRFRLHRSDLPGTPDIVLPRHQLAILVHGCFWHQHPGCQLARQPKSRLDYWLPKFRRNRERDVEVRSALKSKGWKPLVIWECQTKDEAALKQQLVEALPVAPTAR